MARILERRINFEERLALENSSKRFSHVSRVDASPVHIALLEVCRMEVENSREATPFVSRCNWRCFRGEVSQVASSGMTLIGNWLLFFHLKFRRSSGHAYTWQSPWTTPQNTGKKEKYWKLYRCKFCAPCKAFPISLDELGTDLTILIEIFHKKLCCSYLKEEEERKVLSFSAPPCFVSQQKFDFENHFRKIISCSRANECGAEGIWSLLYYFRTALAAARDGARAVSFTRHRNLFIFHACYTYFRDVCFSSRVFM